MKIDTKEPMHYGLLVRTTMQLWMDQGYSKRQFDEELQSIAGSLDENSIFYLMSRGLNYQQSKELLINGFLLDVVEKITDSEIKNLIKNIIGLKEWT